jgi:hypothetical protein
MNCAKNFFLRVSKLSIDFRRRLLSQSRAFLDKVRGKAR